MTCSSVDFTVKWKKDYQAQSKKRKFSVEELGRHYLEYFVEIETWSKSSGRPVPEDCEIPFVNPPAPTLLPISLKMDRWVDDQRYLFLDVTNNHIKDFKVTLPPKEIPEFIHEFFSIGKILTWALREDVDVSHVDFFCVSCALRDIAKTAYCRWSSAWEYSLFYYKDRIFIDRHVDDSERYWKEGLDKPPTDYRREIEIPHAVFDFFEESISVPFIEYTEEFMLQRNLWKYGKKFEDVMKSGGPGDPLYYGQDTDIKCNKLVTLEDHKILTATRISCQSPRGPIDCQENYVEIKTMFPFGQERFARNKSLNLWVHCALVGVDAVYCGIRTADGELREIKKYTMDELVEIGTGFWSPNEIFTFLNTVLSWLKQKLNKNTVRTKHGEEWLKPELDNPAGATFTLSYDGNNVIRLIKADHPELRKVITERYDYRVKSDTDQVDDCNVVPDNWDDSD